MTPSSLKDFGRNCMKSWGLNWILAPLITLKQMDKQKE